MDLGGGMGIGGGMPSSDIGSDLPPEGDVPDLNPTGNPAEGAPELSVPEENENK
jgi:hypothetical protein